MKSLGDSVLKIVFGSKRSLRCYFVCVSVCLTQTCLKFSVSIFILRLQGDFRMTSGWTQSREHSAQRALRGNSETIEQSHFVIPSEPKILRLVLIEFKRNIDKVFEDSRFIHWIDDLRWLCHNKYSLRTM